MQMPRSISARIMTSSVLCAVLALAEPLSAAPNAQFPQLAWRIDERLQKVHGVFPSAIDPDVVFVTSGRGLWRTRDDGQSWKLIRGTNAARLGTVSQIVVCPIRPEFVVLTSLEKGVFLSHDGGSTWVKGGGVAAGLSSEKVHHIEFASEDRDWNTLLVCHDTDGPGISKSVDGGRTWRVLSSSRYFRTLVSMGQYLVASSSVAGEPDNWQMVHSRNCGEAWHVVRRDVLPTTGTRTSLPPARTLWGNRGGRLLASADHGQSWTELDAAPKGMWNSIFVTRSADPRIEWLWAYDPFRQGLLCGRDFKQPWTSRNRGLFVHRMIKHDAGVAVNANATRFYACVNGHLYVGEHASETGGPVIRRAKAEPVVLKLRLSTVTGETQAVVQRACEAINKGADVDAEIARVHQTLRTLAGIRTQRRFVVQVQVDHPKGPGAVRSVSVTPDLLGVGQVLLFDDGKHHDGEPGDGLWGGAFPFADAGIRNAQHLRADPRSPFPGLRGVWVTAVDEAGKKSTWTLLVGLLFERKPYLLWQARLSAPNPPWGRGYQEGNVSITLEKHGGLGGGRRLDIRGEKGPWEAYWATGERDGAGRHDVTGYKYVTFKFLGLPGAGDVAFFLVDELTGGSGYGGSAGEVLEPKRLSNAVRLLKNRYVPAMNGVYYDVKIPVAELVRNVRFMRMHVAGFGLRAGDGEPGGMYLIDEVRFTNE